MATIGLKGIWGLEQLDRTGIATWKLGLLLVGGGIIISGLLLMMLDAQDQVSQLGLVPVPPPQKNANSIVVFCTFIGALLFITLFFSRATGGDLKLLTSVDNQIEESISMLKPRRVILLIFVVVGLLLVFLMFYAPGLLEGGYTVNQLLNTINGSSQRVLVLAYLLIPLLGVVSGAALCTGLMQCKSLVHAARHIDVDLYKLLRYSAIASPLVRTVILVLSFLAFLQFLEILIGVKRLLWFSLVSCVVATPMLIAYGYPVVVLRNRIKEKKEGELMKIEQALEQADMDGDPNKSSIDLSLANTVMYQMFLESRWEWPIASHVQKLILFGLLPPLTWVLAATIEHALY